MPLRVYTKSKRSPYRHQIEVLSYIVLILGAGILFWAIYPMVSFELYAQLFLKRSASSPIPESQTVSSLEFAKSIYSESTSLSSNLRDFTKADLWFPKSKLPSAAEDFQVKEYSLSIPRLNLDELSVVVGGNDLSKSLIHYLPTSLPGQYGNVAIFGHSTLPQLFNSKDYKSVFTYLPKLEVNDSIFITVEGKEYEYEVYNMYIVDADEVSVLEQQFNDAVLTLVTCVPPGTYLQRLIVNARLVRNTALK
ncbi:hypothetical protein COV58_00690 [Candidatus Roizmanbacteria bacterium CG11_big_fil_rev_8_21_14_0_20_36_8]|uniref:Sortase n=2 Tax=Candidatus Roizmaniibacteriota TaxID=1752723 RepID=A0A2M6IV20_9BACT|nr:MAG: hypothetical protein COV58_00690 [Candidatus Roizmanbacteria bacterium CG11_big_fil_rev_8_21_14_0_20_36_8]PIZ66212.1 MAG: hypothetical protein COY14_00710 [Candidatus Roizmanbacteria bacterium CG_4_10_14_0_2_um_filter_36_9]